MKTNPMKTHPILEPKFINVTGLRLKKQLADLINSNPSLQAKFLAEEKEKQQNQEQKHEQKQKEDSAKKRKRWFDHWIVKLIKVLIGVFITIQILTWFWTQVAKLVKAARSMEKAFA